MKILITCPPMLGLKEEFVAPLKAKGFETLCPKVTQTLTEAELIELVPECDGWIIGDDPASQKVFEAGRKGRLRAAVKWGIGVDNVDFEACRELGIPVTNTPNMFGKEVADIAVGYVIGLARETFFIDREIRNGSWPKNRGISLAGKTVGIVGYGDIGQCTAKRLKAMQMDLILYDPARSQADVGEGVLARWPEDISKCDFIVLTCSLNHSNRHMLNQAVFSACKDSVRIVNVARGPLISEDALMGALDTGKVHSAALDVFEREPLPKDSPLRKHSLCIFGSHNSSNTIEAVRKTNQIALEKLLHFLNREGL